MTARWDVIVVGARVAGAATAMLLARAGLRVLCVDRARYGSDTISTHALMRAGTMMLERWGLLDAVVAKGTPPIRRTTFHYGDEQVVVTIKPAAGVDALYAPRRTMLDALLADAAMRSGATLEFGTPAISLLREPQGRIGGVVLRGRDGRVREERAALVVGADGRKSLVADAVGSRVEIAGRAANSYLYGYWADYPVDGYEWFYRDEHTAGVIPTNDGLACIFVGASPDRMAALEGPNKSRADALFTHLAPTDIAARLSSGNRVGAIRRGLSPAGYLREASGPGWALVGDAGYWKDPISTHGMTDALRDAELLAKAIASAPDPGLRQDAALADYQATRDRLSIPMIGVVERIAAFEWDLSSIRGLLLALSSAMTDEVEALTALEPAA